MCPKPLLIVQRQKYTTKDTKSTKELEDISFDAIFQLGHVEIDQQARLDACQFHVTILRALRVLRGDPQRCPLSYGGTNEKCTAKL